MVDSVISVWNESRINLLDWVKALAKAVWSMVSALDDTLIETVRLVIFQL